MVLNDWLIQMLQTQYPREMAHTAGFESYEASMCTADWTRPEVTSDVNPPPAFLHALCSASEDEEQEGSSKRDDSMQIWFYVRNNPYCWN